MQPSLRKLSPSSSTVISLLLIISAVVAEHQQERQHRPAIYINPNPSTRSGPRLFEQPAAASRKQWTGKYLDNNHESARIIIGSTPSSIGRGEQSQVAEWPFFKSLQSARNNQHHQKDLHELGTSESPAPSSPAPNNNANEATNETTSEEEQDIKESSTTTTTTTSTTTTTTSTTTTTTTTTTPAPATEQMETTTTTTEAPTTTAAATTDAPKAEQMDPLFPVELHKSIQQAVNRIVKMGEAQKEGGKPPGEQRNSLSLNVLLKNFGMNNLSSMDQILLKSRLRNDTSSSQKLSPTEQKIEIRGLQKSTGDAVERKEVDESNNEEDDYRQAECKIEYTMRHVNISLMNGPRGDYTCDYIIDRKMTSEKAMKGEGIALTKVCKLQLTSQFFSNESLTIGCNNTYLAIGQLRFCYLPTKSTQSSLDRSFEFPMEKEAFDVKMVHKQHDESDEAPEIHLEIKPMADAECAPRPKPSPSNGPPASSQSVENQTSNRETPAANNQQVAGRSITVANNHAPARRKFILKLGPDKQQLHPLNRFKVSQTFDISARPPSTSMHYSGGGDLEEEPTPTTTNLCDGRAHDMVAGQLATPHYPNPYPANTSCSFDIKRASPAHCHLLLHFRDFDLVTNSTSSEQCLGDYLQIGHTRYCNKYAMIGHKMHLEFPAASNHVRLTFRSDSNQARGRGLLVRYKQSLCASSAPDQQQRQQQQTVAAPMQQPDFSLALKTTPTPPAQNVSQTQRKPKVSSAGPSKQGAPAPNRLLPSGESLTAKKKLQEATTMVASTSSLVPQSVDLAMEPAAASECSSVNNEMSFLLSSPNYPKDYSNNLECLYYVRRNTSQVCYVELTFIKFDLEADPDCRYDYLEINNIRLCGSLKDLAHKTTRIYFFNEPIKLIKFKSDQSHSRPGFLIRVDQLQCAASDGSILRGPPSPSLNVSRTIEYDDNRKQPVGRQLQDHPPPVAADNQRQTSCDQLLFGKEATIKSPLWPESYANDDSLTACRYQIVRQTGGKNKICQLELRFVNLRLGVSDCIDVDGYEVLCGFNARNMVNYYPFDRQSHLTITFLAGSSANNNNQQRLASAKRRSLSGDLLPARSGPLRFMILAKQHECIDGFLAPQSELGSYNQTNLLYSDGGKLPSTVEKKTNSSQLNYDFSSVSVPTNPQKAAMFSLLPSSNNCQDGSLVIRGDELHTLHYPLVFKQESHCTLEVTRQRESVCQLELEFIDLDLVGSLKDDCAGRYLQVGGSRFCHMGQVERRLGSKRILQVPFAGFNSLPITLHSERPSGLSGGGGSDTRRRGLLIKHRQLDCQPLSLDQRRKLIDRQPLVAFSPPNNRCLVQFSQYNGIMSSASVLQKGLVAGSRTSTGTCEIQIKLLPGYCHVQLSFGEFELAPRSLNQLCAADFLELDGSAYCGQELKNATRQLNPSLNHHQRQVVLRYSTSSSSNVTTFRAIFKQLECQAELPALGHEAKSPKDGATPSRDPPSELKSEDEGEKRVEFKELTMKSEFFELNSAKLSKSTSSYEPNMFVIYRIKKVAAEVCKLRLMFYQFDLEPSVGCKRDFLDINNVDRLCGQLDRSAADSTRRDYDWPASSDKDFLISFVSDSKLQREGYLVFGQQLYSNCSSSPSSPAVGNQQTGSTSTTTTSTTTTTTTTTTASPVTYDEEAPQMQSKAVSAPKETGNDNCYQLHYEHKFSLTSPNWPQRYPAKSTCYYLIHKSSADVCSLNVQVQSLVLDSSSADECDTSRQDHLLVDGQPLCGLANRPRSLQVEFGPQRQFVAIKFTSYTGSGFGFYLDVAQNKCTNSSSSSLMTTQKLEPTKHETSTNSCNQLITDELSFVESDNFPSAYPHNQDCLIAFRRPNATICAIDLVMQHFDLESTNDCSSDYLEIDNHRLCGSYPAGHRLRFSYFGQEPDKLLRFRSDASRARSGFSLQVSQVSECSLPTEEGHQETPTTSAPTTTTSTAASTTTAQQRDQEIIGYLPSRASPVATATATNKQPPAAAASPRQAGTLCQFVYHRQRQLLVSPGYLEAGGGHHEPNMDCQYKILARSYDVCSLRLTFLDLSLEPSSDCHQDYLLIDNQRYCSNSSAPASRQLELPFPDQLPREIHLIYHTSASSSSSSSPSRFGFKILSEQLACPSDVHHQASTKETEEKGEESREPKTSQEQRLARRLKFGQLSYPRNYVSEVASSKQQQHQHRMRPDNDHQHPSVMSAMMTLNSDEQQRPQIAAVDLDQQQQQQQEDEAALTLRKGIMVARTTK